MKQLLFTLTFLAAFATTMVAQATFAIEPLSVSTIANPATYDTENHVEVINLTSGALSINWERVVIDISQGCMTQVCDPVACFADFISTHTFNLAASDTVDLIVHFLNGTGNQGNAIVHLKVKDNANPSNIITAIYLFNDGTSASSNLLPPANVKLFPNPVADQFQLQNADDVASVRVYDMQGRMVSNLNASAGQRFDVAGLTPGTYILALEEKNGNVFQAIEMVKK